MCGCKTNPAELSTLSISSPCSISATQSALSLTVLRSMAMLSATVLFIPFVSILQQTFECESGHWIVHSSFQCFSGFHTFCMVLVSLSLPSFIALSIFMTTVFFERDIRSKTINTQIHGKFKACIKCDEMLKTT